MDSRTNLVIGMDSGTNHVIGMDSRTNQVIGMDSRNNQVIGIDSRTNQVILNSNKPMNTYIIFTTVDKLKTNLDTLKFQAKHEFTPTFNNAMIFDVNM